MSQGPRGPDPGDSPGFLLWRATLRRQRVIATALKPLGLTHAQFVLLADLWWFNARHRRPSQRELADHTGTDIMMTSQVVRTLAGKGLLDRTVDDRDARKRVLTITPQGRALAERAVQVAADADERYFATVSDQAALLVVLRGLAAWPRE